MRCDTSLGDHNPLRVSPENLPTPPTLVRIVSDPCAPRRRSDVQTMVDVTLKRISVLETPGVKKQKTKKDNVVMERAPQHH